MDTPSVENPLVLADKINFLVRTDICQWGGWGPSKQRGGGQNVQYVPWTQEKQTFGGMSSMEYCRDIPGMPKQFENKVCVQFSLKFSQTSLNARRMLGADDPSFAWSSFPYVSFQGFPCCLRGFQWKPFSKDCKSSAEREILPLWKVSLFFFSRKTGKIW